MLAFQHAVKEARYSYFSNLIASSCHKPRVLFQAINSVLIPPPSQLMTASTERCEQFLHHFINNIDSIRLNITPVMRNLLIFTEPSASMPRFKQISVSDSVELISHLNSSTCQLDIIPTRFLKEVFQSVGP